MTKVLGVLAIIVVIFGGYKLWEVWDTYDKEKDLKAQEIAQREVKGDSLPGLPGDVPNIQETLRKAQENGATGLRNWLKAYGARTEDPRRAWIELDYMVLVSKDDTAEAKKIFAMVAGRLATNSPVYSRVQQLRPTFGN